MEGDGDGDGRGKDEDSGAPVEGGNCTLVCMSPCAADVMTLLQSAAHNSASSHRGIEAALPPSESGLDVQPEKLLFNML